MTSYSWNDFEDRRRFAQKLRELENWSSDEEDVEPKKTVGKRQKGSRSYNDIPVERRRAMAQRLREQENWSSDDEEDEPEKTVRKSIKESSQSYNHIPDERRMAIAQKLRDRPKKTVGKIKRKKAFPYSKKNSRSWINDFEDRRQFAQKLREEENWSSDEEEVELKLAAGKGSSQSSNHIPDERRMVYMESSLSYNHIPDERRMAIAQKLRDRPSLPMTFPLGKIKREKLSSMGSTKTGDTSNSVELVQHQSEEVSEPSSGSQGSSRMFSKCEIQEATNNLSDSLKIGEGGYGTVYKGYIDNTDVAIKILSNTSDQGMTAFHRELGALNGVRHANLVNLIGSCSEVGALVYEYVPNGSLEDCLMERSAELTWEIRTRIIYEICTILMFLHSNQPDPLVHGDLKPRNVLLGANFKTKLADFGLCRFLTQVGNSGKFHLTKMSFGTPGYIDPDFLESGVVKPAIDVYSFGKTIIRILTKERPAEISRKVHEARKTKTLMTIVDPAARGWPEEIVELLARFALRCCKYDRYKPEFMRKFYRDLKMKLDSFWLI